MANVRERERESRRASASNVATKPSSHGDVILAPPAGTRQKEMDAIRDVTGNREKLMHNEPVGGNQTSGRDEREKEEEEKGVALTRRHWTGVQTSKSDAGVV